MKQDVISEHTPAAVFLIFLRLGLTSFGGPIAHLGYFRDEFVTRRKWISEQSYSDIIALCQFLPGPASSQVGIALGLSQAGYSGALAAWAGFTLPSAILLILFAQGISSYGKLVPPGALHGLKVVAVAVVAQAVWGMMRNLCPDATRVTIMAVATCVLLLFPGALSQLGVIGVAAIIGLFICQPGHNERHEPLNIPVRPRTGAFWLTLFLILLAGLPILAAIYPNHTLVMVEAFYRTGSLVFGGGHVVLPLLQAEVVPTGWVSNETFLAGYAAAQAVPGPLFTFAAFLGASMNPFPSGWEGGILCLLAIFAPSFLLVTGTLPFWDLVKENIRIRAALSGINAAVVGLLLAALYNPVWTSAIHTPQDFCLGLLALVSLTSWRLPPWLVVMCGGFVGGMI
ncbi:MAG TPA: chromate efflux transporter [Klebsiella sp.]|jgi:chromate transporter